MKIAIFTGFYIPFLGGIERYTSKLAGELTSLGHEVIIVTTNHDNLPSCVPGNPTVFRLPTHRMFKNRYPILRKNTEFKKLMHEIESLGIDGVICNTRFQLTTLLGARFAKRHKLPVIVIEHGSSHFSVGVGALDILGKAYEHVLTYLVKAYVDNFYGVSKRCNEWLGHYHIEAKGVFYNSVDADTHGVFSMQPYKRSFGDDSIVITYAGRILKEKGVELLIKSFLEIERKYDNVVLVIAGDGPLLPFLKEKYRGPRIFFEGKLTYEDTMRLFNCTDIFCYPSMYPEGLPTSILEAGIMGCAVIATDRGGTVEVINSRRYGIIIDENQDSLVKALNDLVLDPGRLSKLKVNLQKRIEQSFTWRMTAQKVDRVMRSFDND